MKTDVEQIQSGPLPPAIPPPHAPAKAKDPRGLTIAAVAAAPCWWPEACSFSWAGREESVSSHQPVDPTRDTPRPSAEVVKTQPPEAAIHTPLSATPLP